MSINIPQSSLPRVVIAGGGFGGLKLAQSLDSNLSKSYSLTIITIISFPTDLSSGLLGLEPSSIAFPFRSAFRKKKELPLSYG